MAKGQLAEIEQDLLTAVKAYAIGASLSETPFEYYNRQAEIFKQVGDWSQAEQAYRSAQKARPDLIWVYVEIGNVRYLSGDYADALNWYKQADTLSPNDPDIVYHLGETLYQQNKYSAAKVYFEKVLSLIPAHVKANYYLAQCLYIENQKEEAIMYLAKAVDTSVEKHWIWAEQLGDWYLEVGDRTHALSAYLKGLDWMPDNQGLIEKIKILETR